MFESRRKAKEEREEERQKAIERGWGLLSAYRPEPAVDLVDRYGVEGMTATTVEQSALEIDLRERQPNPLINGSPTHSTVAVPTTAHAQQASARFDLTDNRIDVISGLSEGMRAWLMFYFRLEDGDDAERLAVASNGLDDAATSLRRVGERLDALDVTMPASREQRLISYSTGVAMWARAIELMAIGCRLDQGVRARDGYELLNRGTAFVRAELEYSPEAVDPPSLGQALRALEDMNPSVRVRKAAIRAAKEPWAESLRAAARANV